MATNSYNYTLSELAKLNPANVFRYKDEIYKTVDEETKQAVTEKQDKLTAGEGITIKNNVISATVKSGETYTAGEGITIQNNVISVKEQKQLVAGSGVTIKDNVISVAEQKPLEAGEGVSIKNNVISVVKDKPLEAGNGIVISDNVISISEDLQTKSTLEAGTGILIEEETISVDLTSGNGISVKDGVVSLKMKAGKDMSLSTDKDAAITAFINAWKDSHTLNTTIDLEGVKVILTDNLTQNVYFYIIIKNEKGNLIGKFLTTLESSLPNMSIIYDAKTNKVSFYSDKESLNELSLDGLVLRGGEWGESTTPIEPEEPTPKPPVEIEDTNEYSISYVWDDNIIPSDFNKELYEIDENGSVAYVGEPVETDEGDYRCEDGIPMNNYYVNTDGEIKVCDNSKGTLEGYLREIKTVISSKPSVEEPSSEDERPSTEDAEPSDQEPEVEADENSN